MPEGPEVKLYVNKLNKIYKNKTVKNVDILSEGISKSQLII
tara:strand:+ start:494 stop:616 length:123 start_codon:yes stop_codon:yes gene_type:complete